MIRRLFLGVTLLLMAGAPVPVCGQTDGLLQLDDELHRFLQMQKTKGHLPDAFLSHQPLSVGEAQRYLDSLAVRDSAEQILSPSSRTKLDRLRGTTARPRADWAQRTLPSDVFYENGHDLIAIEGTDYAFQLNPQFYGYVGGASERTDSDRFVNGSAWRNTRGARFSGHVGDHFFFESRLTENQWQPIWDEFADNTAPRVGQISFHDLGDPYDFFDATGILGLRTRHFEIRLGRDRAHWSPGQTSLFLSDFGPVFDQAQIRATLGPIQYTYLLARFLDNDPERIERLPSGPDRPSRFGVFHRIAIHVTDNLELNLYEGVIAGRDTVAGSSNFDPAFLNPIVTFRPVERDLGSAGNALAGIGGSWTPLSGARFYGQFVLDELRVSRIGDEWWGNKWGWMLGMHVVEPGIPHLSGRLEVSRLRPHLYAHRTGASAFTHMSDIMGPPSGPNSYDVSVFLDYEPAGPWRTFLNASWTLRGRNGTNDDGEVTRNYGADPTEPNNERVRSEGVTMLQGIRQQQVLIEGAVSYELLPNLHIMGALRGEVVDDDQLGQDVYLSPRLMLNWGMPFQSLRY